MVEPLGRGLVALGGEIEVDDVIRVRPQARVDVAVVDAGVCAVPGEPGLVADLPEHLIEGAHCKDDAARVPSPRDARNLARKFSPVPSWPEVGQLECPDDIPGSRNRRHRIGRRNKVRHGDRGRFSGGLALVVDRDGQRHAVGEIDQASR